MVKVCQNVTHTGPCEMCHVEHSATTGEQDRPSVYQIPEKKSSEKNSEKIFFRLTFLEGICYNIRGGVFGKIPPRKTPPFHFIKNFQKSQGFFTFELFFIFENNACIFRRICYLFRKFHPSSNGRVAVAYLYLRPFQIMSVLFCPSEE